jgi:polyphosphate kinase
MSRYHNRELSWLEFNQRVLAQAFRQNIPLLERVKFLAISASNLDEFFQVRVGSLMLMRRSGVSKRDNSGLTPLRNLTAIRERVLKMNADQYELLNTILLPALKEQGISLLSYEQLNDAQRSQAAIAFEDHISPLLTPLAVDEDATPPMVPALQIIIACRLLDPAENSSRYALIPIPENLPRRITVSSDDESNAFILIEEVIAHSAQRLFPGEEVTATTAFRVTRNGDIAVQEEDATDLADEMEDVLTARRFADTVRLEIHAEATRDLSSMVQKVTNASSQEIYRHAGPLGLSSFMELAFLADHDHLRDEDWPAQTSPAITPGASMFETISAGDVLLFHPYESFDPVIRLIEEAAVDPDVIAIKQILYRTARQSRIIDALILAAENGKHVTVLVELKARFDEARNLNRADELQRAGAQIVYGVKNLKTHAKICLVLRREAGHIRRYVHLGTGNYNETTSRLYTDLSYLTCKSEYGNDASLLFNAVTGRSKLLRFQRLIPAPSAMKPRLLDLIAGEAERAKQGLPAKIIAKTNSLQDPEIISALYAASQAGVEIKLNVRGICCLIPGESYSENITVISVIDRFLEHARLFYFHQGGDPELFIASADWMTRNLQKRVELMIPIDEKSIRRRLIRILEAYFQDNSNAWLLHSDGSFSPVGAEKGKKPFRAQAHFYDQSRRAAKAREHERSMTFEPHVPQD